MIFCDLTGKGHKEDLCTFAIALGHNTRHATLILCRRLNKITSALKPRWDLTVNRVEFNDAAFSVSV
jgi:hypothetical protein